MFQGEHINQVDYFRLLGLVTHKLPVVEFIFAIPNGGHRHKGTAIRMKKEGVKSGVWDICVPIARQNYHGLYIEFKYGKGTLTDSQKRYQDFFEQQGYLCKVFYDSLKAFRFTINYISGKEPEYYGVKIYE